MIDKTHLKKEDLNMYSENFHADKAALIAANASVSFGLSKSVEDYEAMRKLPNTFSLNLEQGSITNQKSSGRCWLFAALNVFRYEMMKKWNLKDFELSQNYMYFWDKLEKCNYYLNTMIETVEEPIDGRLFSFLNTNPINDGGQWDMFANIVSKYGVVPLEAYPDSANSIASRDFTEYLTSLLREYGFHIREAVSSGKDPYSLKEEMMNTIYRILCIVLGEPPKTFDFTLRDKDDNVTQDFNITPLEFYQKYIGLNMDDYISLIHAPSDDKPMNQTYTVEYLGNVSDGKPVKYLNVDMDVIKKAAIAQIQDGHPVWFGSDCTKFYVRKDGIFDRASFNIESLFGIEYKFTKGQRLMYGDSAMNHAMVLLGVNLDEKGMPDRWRIENSWGKDSGRDGYFTAGDGWFDEFVYQVVVDKQYLDEAVVKQFDTEPVVLKPWDPMGSLAD